MQKFKLSIEKEITVEFDENSDSFKELWDGYKDAIDRNADHENLARSIGSMIARYGIKHFIEGVGIVEHNGEPYEENFPKRVVHHNPINVIVDTDLNGMIDFDVY